MPRATDAGTALSRYEDAWEAINRLIRRGGSWSGFERNCFYTQNRHGEFANVSALFGLDVIEDGRGLAVWDFDRDGDPDLILKSRNAPQVRIWRNDCSPAGARLTLRLLGTVSNRQAVGARATLVAGGQRRMKEVAAGSGFLSQNSYTLFFGLGDAEAAEELTVRWPSGRVQSFRNLPAGRAYSLREGGDRIASQEFLKTVEPAAGPDPQSTIRNPESSVRQPPAASRQPSSPESLVRQPPAASRQPSSSLELWLIDPAPLPAMKLRQLDGSAMDLAPFRGDGLLLALWSPGCPRCLAELEEWSGERRTSRVSLALLALSRAAAGEKEKPSKETERITELSSRLDFRAAVAGDEDILALGILLEEVAHWPREIPVPSSLLLDGAGRVVKLYRGPVAWRKVLADASKIPRALAARLDVALPFPGQYYGTGLTRNDFELGVSYQEAGLLGEAALAFQRELDERPDDADVLYNLGVLHQKRGDPARAREMYLRSLAAQPRFVDALTNLGVILAREGKLEEAAEEFHKVLFIRPDHVEALLNLGNVELDRGRLEEALSAYLRAEALEPEAAHVQKRLGNSYRRSGNPEKAREAYERATRLAPRDAEAWSNLGVIEAEGGDFNGALAAFVKAIEVDPAYASAHSNAGLVYQGLGKEKEAVAHFQRAIELAPELEAPYFNLATLYLRAGKEEEAVLVLRRLLRLKPGHARALELLRQLGEE